MQTRIKLSDYEIIDYSKYTQEELIEEIENLQKENERLKEWKKDLLSENIELENIRKEAIEYMNNEIIIRTIAYDKLYNILKGEDNV